MKKKKNFTHALKKLERMPLVTSGCLGRDNTSKQIPPTLNQITWTFFLTSCALQDKASSHACSPVLSE